MSRGQDRVRNNNVVLCPNDRRTVITSDDPGIANPPIPGDPGPVDAQLLEIVAVLAAEHGADILEAEAMPDHIHLLLTVDPPFGIHTLVRRMTGRSSRLLRHEFPSLRRRLPTLRTNSSVVATVGGAPLSIVKQYVANQRNV